MMTVDMRFETLKQRLTEALSPTHLELIDESRHHAGHPGAASGASHVALAIASEQFEGLSPVQAHRLIYQAVGDLIPGEIHALRIELR